MDDSEKREQGLHSLVESINRALECEICLEDQKELRTLPCCEKLICTQCLETLFGDEEKKKLHGGTPICHSCQAPLTTKPSQYKLSKVAQHFQAYAGKLTKALEKDGKDKCQSEGCSRDVDMWCRRCKKYICYRCDSNSCQSEIDRHDTLDIRDCVVESKECLNRWKQAKEKEIQDLKTKNNEGCQEIKKVCQQLIDTPNNLLPGTCERTIQLISKSQINLEELNGKIAEEESTLRHILDIAGSIHETELIYFVNKLAIYEESREISLGEYELYIRDTLCYDVSTCKAGQHLLVAKRGGLDVLDVGNRKVITSVKLGHRAFTVESYNDSIVVGVNRDAESHMDLVTLDSDYEEVSRWSTNSRGCDFTVIDDKVYVTGLSRHSGDIKVFSLAGAELQSQEILWNGSIVGIAGIPPGSIVFGDTTQHRVYKRRVTQSQRQDEWSIDVKFPRCLCIDSNGLVWIRSNKNDSLTILGRDGLRHQNDIMDNKVTALGEINDICVEDDYLYVAHETGMGRFPITYQ